MFTLCTILVLYSLKSCNIIEGVLNWSKWPSRPIWYLRYIVTSMRIRTLYRSMFFQQGLILCLNTKSLFYHDVCHISLCNNLKVYNFKQDSNCLTHIEVGGSLWFAEYTFRVFNRTARMRSMVHRSGVCHSVDICIQWSIMVHLLSQYKNRFLLGISINPRPLCPDVLDQ